MTSTIQQVNNIVQFNGRLITVGNSKAKGTDISIPEDGIRPFLAYHGLLYYQVQDYGIITVLNSSLEKVAEIPEGLSLYNFIGHQDYLLLPSKNTMTHWQVFSYDRMSDTGVAFPYRLSIGDYFFSYNVRSLTCFRPLSMEPLWKIDIPGELDRSPFGDSSTIYLPQQNGELKTLHIKDGSAKWTSNQNETAGYVLFNGQLYKNNGLQLAELNTQDGKVVKTVDYRSLLDVEDLRMTGDYKVYADVVLVKDQLRGHVLAIDCTTFTLQHHLPVGAKLRSENNFIHWYQNKIYALDMNQALHIG
jgi:hypothetical protein